MTKDEMKNATATLKPELMLNDDAKNMFVDIVSQIDFKVCDNDFETLQLFFKRMYGGIEVLKKKNRELVGELEVCQKEIELLKNQSTNISL